MHGYLHSWRMNIQVGRQGWRSNPQQEPIRPRPGRTRKDSILIHTLLHSAVERLTKGIVSGCGHPRTAFRRERYRYAQALGNICAGYGIQLTWKIVNWTKTNWATNTPTIALEPPFYSFRILFAKQMGHREHTSNTKTPNRVAKDNLRQDRNGWARRKSVKSEFDANTVDVARPPPLDELRWGLQKALRS